VKEDEFIRIGTWNVEWANGVRNPNRLAVLMSHPADIWILTETNRRLDLTATHPFSVCSDTGLDFRGVPKIDEGSTWVTIWSRLEFRGRIKVPDPRRQVAAYFESPKGRFAVAGVVMPWHSDPGEPPKVPAPRNWEEHMRVLEKELPTLLETLLAQIGCRRVLAGDFNTDLAPPPYTYGYGPGRAGRDAWDALLMSAGLVCHTRHVPYLDPPRRNLIDHICTDMGQAQSLTTWTGKDGVTPRLSDHPGVVATFRG
jgi:hypothetical protein